MAFFKKQWMTISEGLRKVSESSDSASLRSHLQAISSDANFHATRAGKPDFEAVLDYIPESKDFFSRILQKIVRLAEAAFSFESKDVQLLVQGVADVVFLTYPEVATILALAFLGLLPNGRKYESTLLSKRRMCISSQYRKTTLFFWAILIRFRKQLVMNRVYVWVALFDLSSWLWRIWRPALVDCAKCDFMTFANQSTNRKPHCMWTLPMPVLAGGIFLNAPGATAQEEITFATHPELCIATILCDALQDNEAVLIHGARHFLSTRGVPRYVRFPGERATRWPGLFLGCNASCDWRADVWWRWNRKTLSVRPQVPCKNEHVKDFPSWAKRN